MTTAEGIGDLAAREAAGEGLRIDWTLPFGIIAKCSGTGGDMPMLREKSAREYAAKARIVKAMAHPTRLLVIDQLLQHGEQCVCELTRTIGTDMSTVSRHLSVLRNAGIVVDEKRGAQVFYRLEMGCVVGFLRCLDTLVEQIAEHEGLLRSPEPFEPANAPWLLSGDDEAVSPRQRAGA